MSSLRASATIIVLRVLARPSAVRAANHWARALFFWNLIKRQASWIMSLRTRTLPARASRRFDTRAKDAGNQADHRVRAFRLRSRSHREFAQAFLFDRTDLVAYDA
ncbi:hypothetical protein QA640_17290 [Bradyrhizobium sp. CB82]|uniref:hypothetical protein n=1 Tax=Bradyrhizobium sp. CB82 TaxID=3039159 RepID=UPI0024B22A6E|nr:hypothetical protein [Bradyrhizobium sp. CB82]WFU44042.1 hypothetical protein QA640_17290 [Bradyrhizobium sp. CB82]